MERQGRYHKTGNHQIKGCNLVISTGIRYTGMQADTGIY